MLPHRLDDHQDGHAGEQGRRDQLEDDETEQQRKIQRYDDEPQNEHQVNERLDIEGVHRQPWFAAAEKEQEKRQIGQQVEGGPQIEPDAADPSRIQ